MTEAKNVAVLLAGGVGVRVGLDVPKQLIKIAGHPIMEHTLGVLDRHPDVDEIIVLMTPGHLDAVHAMVKSGGYRKVTQVLEGADTRSGTTMKALAAIESDDAKVLLHDAVRPLLSNRIITECFAALDDYDAVDVAIPSADTIIEVDEKNTILNVPPRASLRRGQTPQAFTSSVIKEAYRLAAEDPSFEATDDCSVVLRYLPQVPIWVVKGDERNMKVTEPIDLYLADKLFQLTAHDLPETRSEADYREALAGRTMVVFGGSYGIGADIAQLAKEYGANVATFSRSTTGTHVQRREDIVEAATTVLEEHGSIDFVVNTAGVLPRGALVDASDDTIFSATDINYIAPILIAQEFHPHLRATGGSLLLFTSSSYTRGRSGYSLYSSAKAATVNLTQALADEWAADGIRVNCINPERTGTPMRTKAFGEEPPESLLQSTVVARASLDTLLSGGTGHLIDLRRADPLAAALADHEDLADDEAWDDTDS
ncbi:2-C-methyl-D-erythritol 4-phosphate cytidylyltransferase [Nocardioides sp. JQ2195]|uniref:2-C-methyl-D-erythritol 4-phosphate cytidylyltransferase n=1 Tax=Nocardioides sp. JQ2195 TaxID=2592334 RepID=UPI00143EB5BA|nr:2-C-methyl-D-erythritol 4-phosphate cytidylyltransferase [Nocardioides sp. JQ2195]QIX28189.1 2-C-methyl-D-erythritol 4-phosphate cytidylyltransferase [Nocardioides sp. JQ2195]